jgi:hypothetical protein
MDPNERASCVVNSSSDARMHACSLRTFNVDEDPGLIEPFLKESKYTFPVLMAKSYFEGIIPQWSIPRNWMVDDTVTLRLETTGFGGDGDKWLKQVVARLNEPLK